MKSEPLALQSDTAFAGLHPELARAAQSRFRPGLRHSRPIAVRGLVLGVALVAMGLMAGCAGPSRTGDGYTVRETRQPMQVQTGTIESVRVVRLEQARESGVGTAAGAVVGGVAGSNVGRGKGAIVGSVLGAVAGGVAGSQIERAAGDRQGWEIVLRTDDGRTLAIVQEAGSENFAPGQRVRLLTDARGQVRVSPL